MRTLIIVFTWLVGINLSFFGGIQIKNNIDFAWILPTWHFVTYAFATSFVFSMGSRDLLTPGTRRFPTLVTVGIVAIGIVTFNEWVSATGAYTRFLVPSTWLFSFVLISGQSQSWFKTSTILITGLVVSIIGTGIERGDLQNPNWIQVLVAMAMLITNVFLLQNQRSLKFITGITLTLACYFYFEEALLSYFADAFLLKSLTAWWMLAAYLSYESRTLTKYQLLLRDRLEARRARTLM